MDISVVIPVYNVKDYLEKAVSSLENQRISQMEIILVDDGSQDGTEKLVDSLTEKYSNVQSIHQKNSGAAVARNTGIKRAKGKYLYFMDPDDWMEKDMLLNLFSAAEKNNAQLVIAGFTNEYFIKGKYFSTKVQLENRTFNQEQFRLYSPTLLNNTTLAVPWNKLYLSSYVKENQLLFPSVKWDDLHFNMDVIQDIQRVVTISDTSYHFYRTRPGSETTKVFDGKLFLNRKRQFEHVLSNYKAWELTVNQGVMERVYYYYASRILQVVQEISDGHNMRFREQMAKTKEVLNDPETSVALSRSGKKSLPMRICFLILRMKLAIPAILMGKFISLVKNKFSGFFYSKRVKVMQNE
ncbi:hypothetical protein DA798_10225 [Lactobacillus sp. PFC-70]|nr:hypothetical protein DA798_10225 [Lactobacillus sp. PFC-70]